jgi:hypothetical protein
VALVPEGGSRMMRIPREPYLFTKVADDGSSRVVVRRIAARNALVLD